MATPGAGAMPIRTVNSGFPGAAGPGARPAGAKPSEFGVRRGKAPGEGGEFKHIPPGPEGFFCRKIHPPDGAP